MNKLPNYSDKRFLVVDDEQFMMNTVNRMLRMCGAVDIMTALDGSAALKILDRNPDVSCVISDCNMTHVNGLQLLQAIRMGVNSYIPRKIPFVMLTGHGDSGVVQTAKQLDVSGYVVKPVAMDTLVRGIARALDQNLSLKAAGSYQAVKLPKVQSVYQDGSATVRPESLQPSDSELLHRERADDMIGYAGPLVNRRLRRIDELVEGDVLAQDIEGQKGALLLRRGCCLDRAALHRLHAVAAEAHVKNEIWIGEHAA